MTYLPVTHQLVDAVPDAARLVDTITAGDGLAVHTQLRQTDPQQLLAIITALATAAQATTPDTADTETLLRWAVEESSRKVCTESGEVLPRTLHHDEADWTRDELLAAHAAYVHGDRDLWSVEGHRVYDRQRARRRRKATRQQGQGNGNLMGVAS